MRAVITEKCNVMINSEEIIATTEYLTLYAGCRINRCRYNRGSTVFCVYVCVCMCVCVCVCVCAYIRTEDWISGMLDCRY